MEGVSVCITHDHMRRHRLSRIALLHMPPTFALTAPPIRAQACRLPRATYQDLAHTLRSRLAAHPRFAAPRRSQYSFGVDHYAGGLCKRAGMPLPLPSGAQLAGAALIC